MSRFDSIRMQLDSLIAEVDEVVSDHESIRSGDDQYEDPEMWWSYPLLKELKEARDNMDLNC